MAVMGGLFVFAGGAFLTAALWSYLAIWYGIVLASGVVGLLFLTIGCAFLAVMPAVTRAARPAPPPVATPMQSAVEAFFRGLDAGVAARRR